MLKRIIALFFSVLLIICSFALNVSAAECNHKMDSFGVATDPSCTDPGMKWYFCSLCFDYTETALGNPPFGHEYGENDCCIRCEAILGDINTDENVNILDLVALKGMLLTPPEYSYIYDMNADDALNATDMTVLKKMLFEKF